MTTILANIMQEYIRRHTESAVCDEFFLNDLIPDIHMSRYIPIEPRGPWPGCRIIKSHSYANRDYLKVIYVVRNPIAQISSYYDYSRGLGQFSGTFSEFIKDKNLGIRAWERHVRGWATETEKSRRIALLRYEDMRKNTAEALSSVLGAVGADVERDILQLAVDRAEFNKMKEAEKRFKEVDLQTVFGKYKSFLFVKSGRQEADVDISDADREYIESISGETMALLGYKP